MDPRALRRLLASILIAASIASCSTGSDDGSATTTATTPNSATTTPDLAPVGLRAIDGFEPWLGQDPATPPDHRSDRLCFETENFFDPDAEKHDLTCELEGANFATDDPPAGDEITVMTWNLERNIAIDEQIAAFRDGTIPVPDILLASEVDRGCDRSDGVNGAWELANAVGLNYVFGVEFVEGVRENLSTPCEHGQAIFSRHPIGNVELFRHVNTGTDRYDNPDEPRIGTRVDLEADVAIGDRLVRVVSVHYDDRPDEAEEQARNGQARVTAERGLRHEVPTVIGGDMNTILYLLDASPTSSRSVAAKAFWDCGWYDTHVGVPGRITVPFEFGGTTVPALVDLLWVRDPEAVSDPSWCSVADCGELSDHLPQWFTWNLAS